MRKKYKIVVGVDEVGRGSLAGPVVATALFIHNFSNPHSATKLSDRSDLWLFVNKGSKGLIKNPNFIKDSKKLTAHQREKIYNFLKVHPDVEWGIGRVSEKVIDKINIFQATKLAMIRAVKNLTKKLKNQRTKKPKNIRTEKQNSIFLLIDGNFGIELPIPQKSIIKGDEKVFLIKLASITAKVTRDRAMLRYHKKYPQYRFDKHKGYGTRLHFKMLKKCGPCKIHRKSFSLGIPVKN